jgi:ribosomal protein L31
VKAPAAPIALSGCHPRWIATQQVIRTAKKIEK